MTERKPGGADGATSRADRRGTSALGVDLLTELFVNSLDPGYRDAAERRRRDGPRPPAARVTGRAGTAVVLVAFGLLLSVAYQQVVAGAPEAARARERLLAEVHRERAETESMRRKADRLRDDVAAARDQALGSGAEADRLRDLQARAGLARVSGPGISVTLTDGPPPKDPVTGESSGENLGRVLDRDLQRLANALWAAGAEAVAIDGQRLSAVSTIRAAGDAVLVDFTPVTSPYRVRAIGPPDMMSRFTTSKAAGQFRYLHRKYAMGFAVREHDKLTLPAYSEPPLRHAKPVEPSTDRSPSRGGR